MPRTFAVARVIAWVGALLLATPAHAIPPFARKYGTACQTCHTVYPKLNAFGEAFRRRGYRFPGVDSDAVKHEAVPLGHEGVAGVFPGATWPGTLPAEAPLGVSVDGRVVAHSRRGALDAQELVGELHLWAGGSLDDRTTFFGQATATAAGAVSLENAEVHFNDLFGARRPVHLVVGKAVATLSSFGPHSSYLADTALPAVAVTTLLGGTSDGFRLVDAAPGVEVNGLLADRFTWSAGAASGVSVDLRPRENAWVHVGVLGGSFAADPAEGGAAGWADSSWAVDAFAVHARSRFTSSSGAVIDDTASVAGAALRLQLKAVELNAGAFVDSHDHAQGDVMTDSGLTRPGALVVAQYDELSWTVFPWLVPVVRVEYLRTLADGRAPAWDLRVVPGVAVLLRQNLKLVLAAVFETAVGAPPGGWGSAGGLATPTAPGGAVGFQNEAILLNVGAGL